MAKDAAGLSFGGDPSRHPAARAWRRFAPGSAEPGGIAVLKEARHSAVYRLDSAGPDGAPVIAKRSNPAEASVERAVYDSILSFCPVAALRLRGILREESESDPHCWLFLEDAGRTNYSYASAEHRTLAGQWLGAVHCAAARLEATSCLPDRGPGYYLGELRCTSQAIERSLGNSALECDDPRSLEAILAHCHVLESRWSEIETWCSGMPRTLVHGDLAAKNARVRTDETGTSVLIFDWGSAGCGIPAVDLAQFTAHSLSPDLDAWSSAVQGHRLDAGKPARLAQLGRIFRLILAMCWESESLCGPWPGSAMRRIKAFGAELAECLQPAAWSES